MYHGTHSFPRAELLIGHFGNMFSSFSLQPGLDPSFLIYFFYPARKDAKRLTLKK